MAEPLSKLEAVLWDVLVKRLEDGAVELAPAEAQRVRQLATDALETSDSPSSRVPGEVADWIYWNSESLSRDAAERWLESLSQEQVADLSLGDVLAALAPGRTGDIDRLAVENEIERKGE